MSQEDELAELLTDYGLKFTRPERLGGRVDFHLTDFDMYLEVKQHPTERLHDQMESCGVGASIMVLCGPNVVKVFADLLRSVDVWDS